MRKKYLIAVICFIISFISGPCLADDGIGGETEHLLIVSSYGVENSKVNEMISAILEELSKEKVEVNYQIEYMNWDKKVLEPLPTKLAEQYRWMVNDSDIVITIGYSAFVTMQELMKNQDNPPILLAGGMSSRFLNSYEEKIPFIGVGNDIEATVYCEQILDIQPNLEKVYFIPCSYKEQDYFLKEMEQVFKDNNIVVQFLSIPQLSKGQVENRFWKRDNVALFMPYMVQGENLSGPLECFTEIRNYYSGPIYFARGSDFFSVYNQWQGKYGPTGVLARYWAKEGRLIGQMVAKEISNNNFMPLEIEMVPSNQLLDYNSLMDYGLYNDELKDKYGILGLPNFTVVIPAVTTILMLLGALVLLLIVVLSLYRAAKNSSVLAEQGIMGKLRYKRLVELLPDAVIQVKDGQIQYINSAGIRCLNAQGDEQLIGSQIDHFFLTNQPWNQQKNSIVPEREIIKTLNGAQKEVELYSAIYVEPENMMVLVIQDLTEEQKLNEQMERDRLRNEFFSTLSHELRTPVNVVLSTSQLLEKKFQANEELNLNQYNDILRQNSYRLVRLINNLIDSTKLETGFLQLNLQYYNIVEVTENLVLSVLPFAETRGISVVFDTELEEVYASLDKEKYERILLNLLSNGIKYNKEQGTILVYISIVEWRIQLTVRDTGIGIPKEKLNDIFKPFVQVKSSATTHIEGSGIGLSMVSALVELHGGTITVDSKLGEYTEFKIQLDYVCLDDEQVGLVRSSRDDGIEGIQIELSDILD